MQSFRIGPFTIASPLVLAPMAGYTCSAFRLLAREAGASLVFTETISAKGILHANHKTLRLAEFRQEERPIGVQLLGGEPLVVAQAAVRVSQFRPDLIDINFGCPKPKILAKKEGGAMLADPGRALAVVEAVCRAVPLPVTVKLRLPDRFEPERFVTFLQDIEARGAAAITVHPRTVSQRFVGRADWQVFALLAPHLSVPLIASGDVRDAADVRTLLSMGCTAVMIGRAAVGDPLIFTRIACDLDGREPPPCGPRERLGLCLRHIELLRRTHEDLSAVMVMRKQLSHYLRGAHESGVLIRDLMTVRDTATLKARIAALLPE